MRLQLLFSLVLLCFLFYQAGSVKAQGCVGGLLLKPGDELHFQTFRKKKKKPEYSSIHRVTSLEILEDRILAHLKCAFYTSGGGVQRSFDYFIGCKDGKMILDKEVLSDPDNLTLFDDKEFSFNGKNIHYPADAKPGDTLRPATFIVDIHSGPVALATIATKIVNRQVEANHLLETPAGTFNCYRISYTSELTRGSELLKFTTRKNIIEFVVPGLGVVRSEVRNKKCKLKSYTQLVRLQQPKTPTPEPKP